MNSTATLTLTQAGAQSWEVIVVGAGPAGAVAARELARRGRRVLLVDRKSFPRDKVCGCCLSQHALEALRRVGIDDLPSRLGGNKYDKFRLWSRGSSAELALPSGIAVTRRALDNGLVQAAISAQVDFLPGTQAGLPKAHTSLAPSTKDVRMVQLRQGSVEVTVASQIVIVADGGSGHVLEQTPEIEYRTRPHARIGAGAVLPSCDHRGYRAGAIHMGVARHGYVGLVRVENDELNLGAALDPQFVRGWGGLAPAIEAIISESGLPPIDSIDTTALRGTAPLTRRASRVGCHRLFAIGDAAGYAEPFTGEGMAWAIVSATLVVPFALAALDKWRPELESSWSDTYHTAIRGRQNRCFRLALLLRSPWLVSGAVATLARFPKLAQPFVRRMNTLPKEILS